MSSRYYYKKKNRKSKYQSIQDVFNPTMQKAPFPNYYQQKGRTIQTSPLHLWQQDGRVITRKDLDKMYRKLLEYKYPIPNPLAALPAPFYMDKVFTLSELFPAEDQYTLTTQRFKTLMNTHVQTYLPNLYALYTFQFSLFSIQFNVNLPSSVASGIKFQIGWRTNLLDTVRVLVEKNTEEAINPNFNSPTIYPYPNSVSDGHVRITTALMQYISSGGYNLTYITTLSNDTDIRDNGFYPLIDTSVGPDDLYYGSLAYNPIQGPIPDNLPRIRLFVLCKAM